MNQQQKPFGLVATSIYAALWGLICVITGAGLLVNGEGTARDLVMIWAVLVIGILLLWAVFRLRSRAAWSRTLIIGFFALLIGTGLIQIAEEVVDREFSVEGNALRLVSILMAAVVIHYLTNPRIRGLFS